MAGWLRRITTGAFICLFGLFAAAGEIGAGSDYPHSEVTGTSCSSCHYNIATNVEPDWFDIAAPYDGLCESCHNDRLLTDFTVETHSNSDDSPYGEWSIACRTCHWPHKQMQYRTYGSDSFVYSGISTDVQVTSSGTILTMTGADWEEDQYNDYILIPNIQEEDYNFRIIDTTSHTLLVDGEIDSARADVGDTFAIIYGKLIRSLINTPNSGLKTVRFFDTTGTNSYADGGSTYDGVCEVCHTRTTHFRNDGGGSDQLHSNVGGAAGKDCTRCHSHRDSFLHGGSGGGSLNCVECHGHDAGSEYDPDMSLPFEPEAGTSSMGGGSSWSHSTHTETDSDDLVGPAIYCNTCHDTNYFPFFKSGTDSDDDGLYNLDETDVCDDCHSPGGTYNGTDDPEVGAKVNWDTGIYELDANGSRTLRSGKEKWCATCHDEEPSYIEVEGAGVYAPNVIGDEDGIFTYGEGWGYYKTGHGLANSEAYPAAGEVSAGADADCQDCHDIATAHIDYEARTFDDHESSSTDPSEYRQGYRLNLIDGEEPMAIPKTGGTDASNYRLCFSCHPSTPYTESDIAGTNFQDGTNRHYYHLAVNDQYRFKADWGGDDYDSQDFTSRITCITCHNVHGSTRLTMMRDGKLVNREDGVEIWYYNSEISRSGLPPDPEDLPLSASTGLIWEPDSAGRVCSACHGGPSAEIFERGEPFQDTSAGPILEWTDEDGYITDGANPDSGNSGDRFTFMVNYTDINNDAPNPIELWIDADNDGSYESTYTMYEKDPADEIYATGKLYTRTLTLTNSDGNIIRYRFHASDGTYDATGAPTGGNSITLTDYSINNRPVLSWFSGTCRSRGVSPAAGLTGIVFDFAVQYTDEDNEFSSIQVWVDLNDDGDFDDTVNGTFEKQDMVVDGGDGNYTNGENFTKSFILYHNGDGELNYRFVASDGEHSAVGEPTSDHTVAVVEDSANTVTVCASGCDYTSIQTAVDAIDGAQTILVYEGSYNEQISFHCKDPSNDHNTIVRSVCGPDSTTLDGTGISPVVSSSWLCSGSEIEGFEITNGSTAVSVNNAGLTIDNCIIHDNDATAVSFIDDTTPRDTPLIIENSELYANNGTSGGALYIKNGAVPHHEINNTVIYGNTATSGGGAYLGGQVDITDSIIKDNTASGAGGGLYITGAVNMYESMLTGNTAESSGGGAYAPDGDILNMENTLVAGNKAGDGGGFTFDGILTAINCVIADNEADTGNGGGFNTNTYSHFTVRNSIIWGNLSSATMEAHIARISSTSDMEISDSIISNDGDSSISDYPYFVVDSGGSLTIEGFTSDEDPAFVDEVSSDYHIRIFSGAIDTGNATIAPTWDIDGDSRPQGAGVDLGVDEYVSGTGNDAPTLAWTGESGYSVDGVDPESGNAETDFTFRVDYTDSDEDDPVLIQLWLDTDDDGAYDSDEKYSLSGADDNDTVYSDGKRYTKTMSISHAGDGELNYRFYATDGDYEATGNPIYNNTVTLTNSIPTLSWTNEGNYTEDGVEPDSANGGSIFTFRVDYTDADNATPETIQVWVDLNDDGNYTGEKYDMNATDEGNSNYVDGKRYARDLYVGYAGDGIISYRFYAVDSLDPATGTPTVDKTLEILNNNLPVLDWTGETNYESDGVDPDSGISSSIFTFRVDYTDADNAIPAAIQVWVDLNDDGDFDDTVDGTPEKQEMNEVDSEDSDYMDGKRYEKAMSLYYAGDGILDYRFFTNDGTGNATSGAPVDGGNVTVTAGSNVSPVLNWTEETAGYSSDGVDPDKGGYVDPDYSLGTTFTFRVNYSDEDGDAPAAIQVWIDKNDDGDYLDPNEKLDMGAVVADDFDYTDGKLYSVNATIPDPGAGSDGIIAYRFHANDGTADASGSSPVSGATLTVVNPLVVPDEFSPIQAAIDASSDGDVILVREGEYFEKIDFRDSGTGDPRNVTVQAANGPSVTTLRGDGGNNPVVTFQHSELTANAVLEGFTIDNQAAANSNTRGISITNGSSPTVRNCILEGNDVYNTWVEGAGIYINGATASIENTDLGGNAANPNTCQKGCGLYAGSLSGELTITDTTVSENQGVHGGGIYLNANSAVQTTITDSVFDGNDVNQYGGAIYVYNSRLSVSKSTFSNNICTDNGMHGAAIYIYSTDSNADAVFSGSDFYGNNATGSGGAIYADTDAGTPLNMTDCHLNDNNAAGNGGAIYLTNLPNQAGFTDVNATGNNAQKGGGIYINNSPFSFANVRIDNNDAGQEGGGLYLAGSATDGVLNGGSVDDNTGGNGCGIYLNSSELTVNNASVNGNLGNGSAYLGGGLYVYNGSSLVLSSTFVQGNKTGQHGGGINISGGSNATLTNSIIAGNTVGSGTWETGGGIKNDGTLHLYNSTVGGNYAPKGGGLNSVGSSTITNSIFWDNVGGTSDPEIMGTATVTYSDVEGGYAGDGNLKVDPLFIASEAEAASQGTPNSDGNYHIQYGSGVIDKASATDAPLDDIDGEARPYDGDGDESADYDMGADEYMP